MAAFGRLRMPSLGGATGWLNSEPLGPAELEGHVVLVNFWTLTCINWLRQKPYLPSCSAPRRLARAHVGRARPRERAQLAHVGWGGARAGQGSLAHLRE
jgi:hypothetical protein